MLLQEYYFYIKVVYVFKGFLRRKRVPYYFNTFFVYLISKVLYREINTLVYEVGMDRYVIIEELVYQENLWC